MTKSNMFLTAHNVLERKTEVKIHEVVGSMNANPGETEPDIHDSGEVGGLSHNNRTSPVEYTKVGGTAHSDYGATVEEKEDDEENESPEEVDDTEPHDNVKAIPVNGLTTKVKNTTVKLGPLANGEGNEILPPKVIEKA